MSCLARNLLSSVTVDLDFFPGADAFIDEEFCDVTTVVTLELNDVAPFTVFGCCAVAAPSFFEMACQLAHIEIVWQATH